MFPLPLSRWNRQHLLNNAPQIESDNDPRAERARDEIDLTAPTPPEETHPLHGHNPWQHAAADVPDPDEDDINEFHWQSNGPGNVSFHATFHRPRAPPGHANSGHPLYHPMMDSFASMLNGITGGILGTGNNASAQQRQQQQQQQQQNNNQNNTPGYHTHPEDDMDGSEYNTRPQFNQREGMVFTRIIGPGGNLQPRDANNPQAMPPQINDLHQIIQGLFGPGVGPPGAVGGGPPIFMGAGPAGGQRQGQPPHPLAALFNTFLNPANAQHGDAVYTQEALDRVISQLMEANTSGNAPGPASTAAIRSLGRRPLKPSDLDEQTGRAECSICMETVEIGTEVTVLPCQHWFHGECVASWLGEHDSCPHCRRGIMPKDGGPEAGRSRARDEEPMHDQEADLRRTESGGGGGSNGVNSFSMPGSFEPSSQGQRGGASAAHGGDGRGGGQAQNESIAGRVRSFWANRNTQENSGSGSGS